MSDTIEPQEEIESTVPSDVDRMSDDDFQAEFDKMMNSPVEDESDDEEQTEEEVGSIEETEDDSESEEVEPEVETDEEKEDSEEPQEDDDDSDKDSEEDTETDDEEDKDKDLEHPNEDSSNDEPKYLKDLPTDVPLDFDIPVNGSSVKATIDELVTGFKKGMNYTKKMQELAPMRKSLNILSENNISEDKLNMLVDMLNGNPDAAARLLADAGIDSLDIDDDKAKEYIPKDNGSEPVDEEIQSVLMEMESDKENFATIEKEMSNMDENFFNDIASNSENLRGFHLAVSSGEWEAVKPEMMKLSLLSGEKQSIDLYKKAYANIASRQQKAVKEIADAKPKTVKNADIESKRKKLSPTSKNSTVKKEIIKDINDMDEDEFEAEFKKMTGRTIDYYN